MFISETKLKRSTALRNMPKNSEKNKKCNWHENCLSKVYTKKRKKFVWHEKCFCINQTIKTDNTINDNMGQKNEKTAFQNEKQKGKI